MLAAGDRIPDARVWTTPQENATIAEIVADGPIVMTERVDHLIWAERTVSLPLMGIFEIHNGVITAWRDYFDLNQFTSRMADTA